MGRECYHGIVAGIIQRIVRLLTLVAPVVCGINGFIVAVCAVTNIHKPRLLIVYKTAKHASVTRVTATCHRAAVGFLFHQKIQQLRVF